MSKPHSAAPQFERVELIQLFKFDIDDSSLSFADRTFKTKPLHLYGPPKNTRCEGKGREDIFPRLENSQEL